MRSPRRERGQILPLIVLMLIALLGVAAFAIDVGYAYYAKRQLQSATDAAALAGAQDLPNGTSAIATATSYAGSNTPSNLASFNFNYQVTCTAHGRRRHRLRPVGESEPAHGQRHRGDEHLVREALRPHAFRRLGACECV